jgi:hypothetical protein
MNVAIVVIAHNRPAALRRLLGSIVRASYPGDDHVPLLISIDGEGPSEVYEVAREFRWSFGEKTVIAHPAKLGLREHVLSCGDLVQDYDGIIMLEDDLVASPLFYTYGVNALQTYREESRVGGISLYSYRQVYGLPFLPSVAHGDGSLIRFPSSSGQAWTRSQWQGFRCWLRNMGTENRRELDSQLPGFVAAWPSVSSWKKEFARYLVDSNTYVVYPRVALTTNMGDPGYHIEQNSLVHQVPIQVAPMTFRLASLSQMVSYDQFFELEPRSLDLLGIDHDLPVDVEFDLYGQKPLSLLLDKPVISSKQPKSEMPSYGLQLLPHELNVVYGIQGRRFYLGEGAEFVEAVQPSRLDLLKHQTAFLGVRDRANLLYRALVEKVRSHL